MLLSFEKDVLFQVAGAGRGGGGGGGGGSGEFPERVGQPICQVLNSVLCRSAKSLLSGNVHLLNSTRLCIRFSLLLIVMWFLNFQYYMRTGTCKFGASCKYHHPRQGGGSIAPVSLNYLGYPLRQVYIPLHMCLHFQLLFIVSSHLMIFQFMTFS